MSDEWKNSLCWNTKVTGYDALNGCTVEMSPIGRDKIDEISIFRPTTNHNMVICRAFNTEGKPIYETSAKCGPNDVFDFNIGAKIALDRLYEGYDMTPKPKRKPYNGIIRVVWNEDRFDSFEVVDGKLYSRVYVLRLPCQQKYTIYEDSSFEEMKQALLNCGIFLIWNDGKPPMAICRDNVTHRL